MASRLTSSRTPFVLPRPIAYLLTLRSSLPPVDSRNLDSGSRSRLSSPLPASVLAFLFYRERTLASPPLVDSRRGEEYPLGGDDGRINHFPCGDAQQCWCTTPLLRTPNWEVVDTLYGLRCAMSPRGIRHDAHIRP